MRAYIKAIIIIFQLWPLAATAAIGDLTISPTRVIFEGRDRSTQVSLINRGQESATYRVEFIQYRMTSEGEIVEIEEPNENEKFADNLIRYSPRQIELHPNEAQTIRLLLRKPKDLPPGEYRSHLLFYAIPPEGLGTDVETRAAPEGEGFSIAITPVFRISIPVIVRHGDLKAEFSIQDVAIDMEQDEPSLSMTIERDGNRSVYGDLDVEYMPADGGEPLLLGHIKDLVLYTSSNTRNVNMAIHVPDGVALNDGVVKLKYTTSEDGVDQDLAFYELPLN